MIRLMIDYLVDCFNAENLEKVGMIRLMIDYLVDWLNVENLEKVGK